MNTYLPDFAQAWLRRARERPFVSAGAAVAVLVLLTWAWYFRQDPAPSASSYYEVKRGDFLISVVEGGTIEALNEVVIRSEVEGTARIIYIVPEGSTVKKGDLLVELDSSAAQDSVNQQEISVEKAQFALVQAQQQLAIQKSMVDSEVQAAHLKVEFAQSDLDKYLKGEAQKLLRSAQMQTNTDYESVKIAEERLEWSKKLYEQGFETKGNLDHDSLSVTQSRMRLEEAEQDLWMLQTFDQPKQTRKLQSALDEAKDDLARTKLQGERRLAQYQADVETQRRTLELSQKKLDRDQKQIQAAKLLAPQDGLVVYASGGNRFSSESLIEEGAVVRNRQEIIKLPDISAMKLQVKIHESHINNIHRGQPAYIVLDSMPDQRFQGVVTKVAPLPDSSSRWGNPNLKVYATEILVTDPLLNIKPGVSARAEIVVTNLTAVLTVPIQSVTTRNGQQVVFLSDHPRQPVPVQVGMYNTKFIEVASGLEAGNRVLLAPPFDSDEKDLGGGIINQGEAMPTNRVPGSIKTTRQELPKVMPATAVARAAGKPVPDPDPTEALRPRRDGGNRPDRAEPRKRVQPDGNGKPSDTQRATTRERTSGGAGRQPASAEPASSR